MNDNLEHKILQFQNEITELIKGLSLEPFKYGSDSTGELEWNHAHFSLPAENNQYANSRYFYAGKELVHFTKLDSAEAIIKSGVLRLYNLNHLDDPREFLFAGGLFELTESQLIDIKGNMFIASFCETSLLLQKEISEQFNQWRLYGDNGRGVAIVFEVTNNPIQWNNFHLSKIIYGAKNRNLLKKIMNLKSQLKHNDISIDINKLGVLYKSRLYHLEKEVRLFHDRRIERAGFQGITIKDKNNQTVFPIINKCEINKCLDNDCHFLELPLNNTMISEMDEGIPSLRIKKIILGYQWKNNQSKKEELSQLCKSHLLNNVTIEFSNLVKAFWGNELWNK